MQYVIKVGKIFYAMVFFYRNLKSDIFINCFHDRIPALRMDDALSFCENKS